MNVFGEARDVFVGKIRAESPPDVIVTTDPAAAAPCILVDAATNVERVGPGGYRATIAVVPMYPPPGNAAALDWLGDMLEVVLTALGACSSPATAGTYGAKDVPCYRIPYTIQIADPNC